MRSTGLLSPSARRASSDRVAPGHFTVPGRREERSAGLVAGRRLSSSAWPLPPSRPCCVSPAWPATKTIWAEDGRIFYAQATTLSFWRTLTTLHNGYMQLFPRLAVQLVRFVPRHDVSDAVALSSVRSAWGALCCPGLPYGHGAYRRSRSAGACWRPGWSLLPVANVELLNNLVNVPWWLFFAAFWALLWRPRPGPAGRVRRSCALWPPDQRLWSAFSYRWPWPEPIVLPRAPRSRRPVEGSSSGLLYQAVVILPVGRQALSSPGGLHDVGAVVRRKGRPRALWAE